MQIAQPGMNMDQDRQMLMVEDNVRNQFRPNAVHNVRNQVAQNVVQNPGIQIVENMNGLSVVSKITNKYGNRNVVTAPAKGNGNGINSNPIRCYNCRGEGASNFPVKQRKRDAAYLHQQLQIAQEEEAGIQSTQEEFKFMAAADASKEAERVKANCILENNLQQSSTSDTQSDKAPISDSDGLAEVHLSKNCYDNDIFNMFTQEEQYTELLEPISEPHQVPQNDSNVNSEDTTSGTSENTKFAKQSILGKPPSSSRPRLYAVTPLPKSMIFLKGRQLCANKHVKASVRTKPITVLQSHVITIKDVNSITNGFSPKNVESTTRTRRPQPRNNLKIDKVPFKSKSSCLSTKLHKIEENHKSLQSSNYPDHTSSECNNMKLAIRNEKSEVICATCKQCLITANHHDCVLQYVNGMKSSKKNQSANVSKSANQKKHKANVKKANNSGSKESLASPSKPRSFLRWLPTGRIFYLCGKITSSSNTKSESDTSSWKVYSVICSTNYSNGENQVVSKSTTVTIADAFDKRQQQQDSTSSTSTLATTITADGIFDL
uniref:Gag-Pol polyprotein n=1 Tax=Tanacetum cinerariifolium TaxID=118510 RepID=A0A6L2K9W8_TANCI|nr:hypothetical protein [Tanacetum cinerariifolium]